jgi:hypothetical protein
MTRRTLILAGLFFMALAPAAGAATPFMQDPMGPMSDVTANWQAYQPASAFCIKPNAKQYTPGGTGATLTGRNPVCRQSGFPRKAKGLYKVQIQTPPLCQGCRRIFIDFSKIAPNTGPGSATASGHVYYHLDSFNPSYQVSPTQHSPNTKDFWNDKLVTPDGSPQQPFVLGFDSHAIEYVSDTKAFVHNQSQGPWYIGPWYLSQGGQRIRGVYLDLDLSGATRLPLAQLNTVGYMAGFDSGGTACPKTDDDLLYAGCVDAFGGSATMIDPWAG